MEPKNTNGLLSVFGGGPQTKQVTLLFIFFNIYHSKFFILKKEEEGQTKKKQVTHDPSVHLDFQYIFQMGTLYKLSKLSLPHLNIFHVKAKIKPTCKLLRF